MAINITDVLCFSGKLDALFNFTKCFSMVYYFSGKPNPPVNVSVTCSVLQATVSWVSQYDGLGDTGNQVFYVMYSRTGQNDHINDTNIPDAGENKRHEKVIRLSSGQWEFKVGANNEIGGVVSGNSASCKVLGKLSFQDYLLPHCMHSK